MHHACSVEVACKSAFGEQGLGKCTVFQLAYSAITLFRKLSEQGGLELVDKYSAKLLEVLKNSNSRGWEVEGEGYRWSKWLSLLLRRCVRLLIRLNDDLVMTQ